MPGVDLGPSNPMARWPYATHEQIERLRVYATSRRPSPYAGSGQMREDLVAVLRSLPSPMEKTK